MAGIKCGGSDGEHFGEIHIADEVLAVIAGTAAMECEGIKGTVGNMAGDIAGKLGVKSFSKGVKITFEEDGAIVDLALIVKAGHKIQAACEEVQEKVKTALETMTGITVLKVNVHVQGLERKEQA